ncbi:aspartyl-phosphate phosphatase Spo0E family protein [Paenisporosarcina antarctica]|uniref:Aspartyl-phosphate phosphatase Spo0E family protein n=1 Tax=Paenisporosarcina antarctica TaxID=417367 RepID=A0A4P7A347_9BACL|nr:aspartyl-phosphate phosphatase Spo0E family protein [Paenisporosarcina antarctica]QBP43138.1 aspartyl-phosphate phosphatase Spo0E family protein [Paenisporosarcina antarctica]
MGKIKLKKRKMYRSAKRFGFTDSRVVTCSQDLDILLNRYQEIMEVTFVFSVFIAFVNKGNGLSN